MATRRRRILLQLACGDRPWPSRGAGAAVLAAVIGYAAWKPWDGASHWIAAGWLPDWRLEFLKRGLPGQLLPLRVELATVDAVGTAVLAVLAAGCALGAVWLFVRTERGAPEHAGPVHRWLLLFAVAPFSLVQLASEVGRFDHLGWIVVGLCLLCLWARGPWGWVPVLLAPVAVLVHEVTLLLHLPLLFAVWIAVPARVTWRPLLAALSSCGIAAVAVAGPGTLDAPLARLAAHLDARAADFPVPAGFAELYAFGVADTVAVTLERWTGRTVRHLVTFAVLGSPLLVLTVRLWRRLLEDAPRKAGLLPASALCGLPLFVLGFDFFRWIAVLLFHQWLAIAIFAAARGRLDRVGQTVREAPMCTFLAFVSSLYLGPLGATVIFDQRLALLRPG